MRRTCHYHSIDFIVAVNESKMEFPRFLKVRFHQMILELSCEYMIKIEFSGRSHKKFNNDYQKMIIVPQSTYSIFCQYPKALFKSNFNRGEHREDVNIYETA